MHMLPFDELLTPPVSWPLALGIALAFVLVLELVYRALYLSLQRAVEATRTKLDDVLLRRMRLPAQVLVFLAGGNALFALRGIENAALSKAFTIVELLLVAYLVIEALETLALDYFLAERKQVQVPSVVRGLLLVVLYTVAIWSVVGSVTGVNLAPVLATSTVVTVVLGLALQDTLGNLFAGLAMSLEKPFDVGDWILIDGMEARVQTIGWRAVHLSTFNQDSIVVPNGVIAKARVQNFSRPKGAHGRNIEVQAAPLCAPRDVETAARAALARVEGVLPEPAPRVWLIDNGVLAQRWVLKIWLADFAQHDELESQVRRAFVEEIGKRGLSPSQAPAAVATAPPQ